MAEMYGRDCVYEGRKYADGAFVCDSEKCLECNDGDWENADDFSYGRAGLVIAPGKDLSDI